MSSSEFRPLHKPADIIQDAANYLSTANNKPPQLKPIVRDFAEAVNKIALGQIVDLNVQFKNNEGEPMGTDHVGTVIFNGYHEEDDRWIAKMKSINAGGFNKWSTEGIEIPLSADCLIISDISPAE